MKHPDVKLKSGGQYAEIYGSDGLAFNFLHPDTFEAYHFPTMCKDFFTDAFWSEAHGKETRIHGFKWVPGWLPKGARRFEMALKFGSKPMGEKSETIQEFLNKWERSMEIPLSLVRPDLSGKLTVIQFDQAWASRPVMISMLTLLMRLAPAYDGAPMDKFLAKIARNGNPYGMYDKSEISKPGVLDLLNEVYESGNHPHPKQTYKQYGQAVTAHHSGGLIAYTTGCATG